MRLAVMFLVVLVPGLASAANAQVDMEKARALARVYALQHGNECGYTLDTAKADRYMNRVLVGFKNEWEGANFFLPLMGKELKACQSADEDAKQTICKQARRTVFVYGLGTIN